MVISIDILPSDVIALGMGLILFNIGLVVWLGPNVDFLAEALRLEGPEGKRTALITGRWLTLLGLVTFLMPFLTRAFGPVSWWPYVIIFVAGGLRVFITAFRHYRRPHGKA